MIGEIISAGSKLIGGFLDKSAANEKNRAAAAAAQTEYEHQKEFAQSGVRWKAADARAAGLHPLYAMGASTSSYSPTAVGIEKASIGSSLAEAGADIGSAINKTRTAPEKADAFTTAANKLTLEKGALENEILKTDLASRVARLSQNPSPDMPTATGKRMLDGQGNTALQVPPIPAEKKLDPSPNIWLGGRKVIADPLTTNAEKWEDRYGDDGPASWVGGVATGWNDFKHNVNTGNLTRQDFVNFLANQLGWIDRSTSIGNIGTNPIRLGRGRRTLK